MGTAGVLKPWAWRTLARERVVRRDAAVRSPSVRAAKGEQWQGSSPGQSEAGEPWGGGVSEHGAEDGCP